MAPAVIGHRAKRGDRTVALDRLRTLWVDTGSDGADDGLAYFRLGDLEPYLAEIERDALGTEEVGFIGGDPFVNPDLPAMVEAVLDRGLQATVRTPVLGSIGRVAEALM